MLRNRDKAIIADLERFRAMTREQISTIHFSNVKHTVKETNAVMLRLKRDGLVSVSKEHRMYTYYPAKSIKKNSSKLEHYLAIVDFYCAIIKNNIPRRFDVEPKLSSKGTVEPDVFTIWNRTGFFVEVQLSDYTAKQWKEKLNRYEEYYLSGEWKSLPWQPKDKPLFPFIWFVGKGPVDTSGYSFKCINATVEEMALKFHKQN